ncbi:GGDEF domain-containing protein [Serpentinicella alkaliphila]|uniref:Diguanylate cyclase (GGDEF)-like protein n=1 Tax=Serpentinicella alkaliphila TaxID=1734049 RepID=A0A4R2TLB9_9FIRM|nr:GGDEF domain-containing protein [Serpentinicella alkaliphila]QUH26442.1 GGDEF domain-containing protein [Serpentinicella alkaliphila]TCQ03287.1 diguanylate cyclase (GGDEF)-like protein [Serpentinicella alkaliphila]
MENNRINDISFIGEFLDKELESEFFEYDMQRYSKVLGPVALVFGLIYMLFLISDYFALTDQFSFNVILMIRIMFLVLSVVVSIQFKRINNYSNLALFITAYEMVAITGFLLIMHYYETLTILSFFSVMVMTLAIYIIPNKLFYSQLVSIFLSISFYLFNIKHVTGIENSEFIKIIAYNLIVLMYCNIGSYLTNYYKRKQFVDSKELQKASITDYMTGIYNRAKFSEQLNYLVDDCNGSKSLLSLVIFDIDDFKKVNDTYGHLVGDSVIKKIAAIIKNSIRSTDIFARWGGDEFVMLLPNTSINQAMDMIERIRVRIQDNDFEKIKHITCSFGLVELRSNETVESFLQRADNLLYNAKESGKNMLVYESPITDGQVYKESLQVDSAS